jgi:hypothetical protein
MVYYWLADLWVFLEFMVHTWKNLSSSQATWLIWFWNLQPNTEKCQALVDELIYTAQPLALRTNCDAKLAATFCAPTIALHSQQYGWQLCRIWSGRPTSNPCSDPYPTNSGRVPMGSRTHGSNFGPCAATKEKTSLSEKASRGTFTTSHSHSCPPVLVRVEKVVVPARGMEWHFPGSLTCKSKRQSNDLWRIWNTKQMYLNY